jgi:hypothetical protein
MIVITETGSKYVLEGSICYKYNSKGRGVDAFKLYHMTPVPLDVEDISEVFKLPQGDPEVGKRLYVSGKDSYWLSTKVVEIRSSEDNKEKVVDASKYERSVELVEMNEAQELAVKVVMQEGALRFQELVIAELKKRGMGDAITVVEEVELEL